MILNKNKTILANLTNFEKRILLSEVYFSKKLAEYFSAIVPHDKLGFLPDGATSIKISDVRKLSKRDKGNHVYSFLLIISGWGFSATKFPYF